MVFCSPPKQKTPGYQMIRRRGVSAVVDPGVPWHGAGTTADIAAGSFATIVPRIGALSGKTLRPSAFASFAYRESPAASRVPTKGGF